MKIINLIQYIIIIFQIIEEKPILYKVFNKIFLGHDIGEYHTI